MIHIMILESLGLFCWRWFWVVRRHGWPAGRKGGRTRFPVYFMGSLQSIWDSPFLQPGSAIQRPGFGLLWHLQCICFLDMNGKKVDEPDVQQHWHNYNYNVKWIVLWICSIKMNITEQSWLGKVCIMPENWRYNYLVA